MNFEIPRKYTVGGQDVEVFIVESDGTDLGSSNLSKGIVKICLKCDDCPQSETSMLNTFFHELTHTILRSMGEFELNNNEKFVNCFAGFLTEAIRTMDKTMGRKNDTIEAKEAHPELIESEDEKVRKSLVEIFYLVKENKKPVISKENADLILAWLEKQGEERPSWSE